MDAGWIFTSVVAPVVASVVGLVVTVVVPIVGFKLTAYLNRKFKLDIDAKEQKKVESIAVDLIHLAEAQIGPKQGKRKMAEVLPELVKKSTEAGIDIASDMAQAKIEKMLVHEGIVPAAAS